MRKTHTDDGRLIDSKTGIPEGAKPFGPCCYTENGGKTMWFRFNLGEECVSSYEPPTLTSVVESLRPIADDLQVVNDGLIDRIRNNAESGTFLLTESKVAGRLLDALREAINYIDN